MVAPPGSTREQGCGGFGGGRQRLWRRSGAAAMVARHRRAAWSRGPTDGHGTATRPWPPWWCPPPPMAGKEPGRGGRGGLRRWSRPAGAAVVEGLVAAGSRTGARPPPRPMARVRHGGRGAAAELRLLERRGVASRAEALRRRGRRRSGRAGAVAHWLLSSSGGGGATVAATEAGGWDGRECSGARGPVPIAGIRHSSSE